jgi:hypothetical protein
MMLLECSYSLAGRPDRHVSVNRVMARVAATALSALATAAISLFLLATAVAVDTRNVLVLYSNNRLVPGNVSVDRGLRAALLVHDALIAAYLACLFVIGQLGGPLLWPAVMLHAVVALLLAWTWRSAGPGELANP